MTREEPTPLGALIQKHGSLQHALRTPLNQIIGYCELIQEEAIDSGQNLLAHDLAKVVRAARELVTVVDEVVSYVVLPSPVGDRLPHVAPASGVPPPPTIAPPAEEGVRAHPTSPGSHRGAKLLVVDDDEANRDMLARFLRRRGFNVDTADGGGSALARLEQNFYDLVLLDVMMPEVNGLEVLRTLRAQVHRADLPVIIVTARSSCEDVVEALSLGANDYVTKPIDLKVVNARVETQLSLKRSKERVQVLNRQLHEAQESLVQLITSANEAIADIGGWSAKFAATVAKSIGAEALEVWTFEGDLLKRMGDESEVSGAPAELLADLRVVAEVGENIERPCYQLIAVRGLADTVLGALVVSGWQLGKLAPPSLRLLEGFAHQLGRALEISQLRKDLDQAVDQRRARLQRQVDHSIADAAAEGSAVIALPPPDDAALRSALAGDEPDQDSYGFTMVVKDPLGTILANRYRVAQEWAQGGMGTVYRGIDERLQRPVAIKVINAEYLHDDTIRARFEQEACAVARIHHPGVVAIFDTGALPDGSLFIVMEWLSGWDLSEILHKHGPGTPADVARLLEQASAGLDAAHQAGLVHRDIKPDNLFLLPGDQGFVVKIVDFGVAKDLSVKFVLTRVGALVGTPQYMPPEQLTGGDVDPRSDLYSLAAVAYQALTGRRVTMAEDLSDMIGDVLYGTPPPPSMLVSGLPLELDEAFMQALAKDPRHRPSSLCQWALEVASLLETVPSTGSAWMESLRWSSWPADDE